MLRVVHHTRCGEHDLTSRPHERLVGLVTQCVAERSLDGPGTVVGGCTNGRCRYGRSSGGTRCRLPLTLAPPRALPLLRDAIRLGALLASAPEFVAANGAVVDDSHFAPPFDTRPSPGSTTACNQFPEPGAARPRGARVSPLVPTRRSVRTQREGKWKARGCPLLGPCKIRPDLGAGSAGCGWPFRSRRESVSCSVSFSRLS